MWLEYRTKEFSPIVSRPHFQPRQKSPSFNKRKVIDLTISDDDDEPVYVGHKKSRSSSQSNDVSAEFRNALKGVDEAAIKPGKEIPLLAYLSTLLLGCMMSSFKLYATTGAYIRLCNSALI